MRIIPAIDLRGGRCVRLVQGKKSDLTVYDQNPEEVARRFFNAGASLIHIVDLDSAFGELETPNREVIAKILEAGVAIQVGGGIRTRDDVQRLCDRGVNHVVLGTVAIEKPLAVKALVEEFGDKICVGIDARDGLVMVRGWELQSNVQATDLARLMVQYGIKRIVYTDIRRDGTLSGPNIEQTVALAREAKVKVTASGGVSQLDDLRRLRDAGEPLVDSVVVGKALYEGRFNLEEAIRIGLQNQERSDCAN